MTHGEKLEWLAKYAAKIGARLELEGEVGICRDCVGLIRDGSYPDYPEDAPVTAKDAYHKHKCLAVLGRGEESESQLFDWCQALEKAGFNKVETRKNPGYDPRDGAIGLILGTHKIIELVKEPA